MAPRTVSGPSDISAYAEALELQPQRIRGEVCFRCPSCQQHDISDHDWPARSRPHFVASLGEGPMCVSRDGMTWRCGSCGRRGTIHTLRLKALNDPDALRRLQELAA